MKVPAAWTIKKYHGNVQSDTNSLGGEIIKTLYKTMRWGLALGVAFILTIVPFREKQITTEGFKYRLHKGLIGPVWVESSLDTGNKGVDRWYYRGRLTHDKTGGSVIYKVAPATAYQDERVSHAPVPAELARVF